MVRQGESGGGALAGRTELRCVDMFVWECLIDQIFNHHGRFERSIHDWVINLEVDTGVKQNRGIRRKLSVQKSNERLG